MGNSWDPKLPQGSPLCRHPRGYIAWIAGRTRWICGQLPYDEALKIYHRKAAALVAGEKPIDEPKRAAGGVVTIASILNGWYFDNRAACDRGDIGLDILNQYKLSAKRIVNLVGHYRVDDWTPDLTQGLYSKLVGSFKADFAKRAICHFRIACDNAEEMSWCRPISYGRKLIGRLAARPRARMTANIYTPEQIRAIVAAAKGDADNIEGKRRETAQQLYAMILLALNGGYGARELSQLPREVIDLESAVIDYRRGKTDEDHVVPLWPETVEAIKAVLAQRPGDELLFRTRDGNPWARVEARRKSGKIVGRLSNDNVAYRYNKLTKRLGIRIAGQSFYKLKHAHCTAADAAGDPHATFALSGHALPGAKGHYVRVGLDRVRKVVEHVRQVLLIPLP